MTYESKKVSVFIIQNGSYFPFRCYVSFRSVPFRSVLYSVRVMYSNYHCNLLAFSCCSLKIARSIARVHCRCVAASCRDWAPPSHPAMRTQRTRSQRYLAAHAAVLVTRAEKLSRRYLRAGDSVLQYSHARSYGPVRAYARAPKQSGTEWNGTDNFRFQLGTDTNGTE